MTKEELSSLLHELNIPVNDSISSDENSAEIPRIVYWDYIWDDVMSSGETYSEMATYQISFYSDRPRDPKLIELGDKLREVGIHPTIYHEYISEDRIFHSYFSVEILR